MNKRPLPITIIAWLFIAAGIVGLTYHSTKLFDADSPVQPELILVLALRVLVIVCGVFILRGGNWARWLLLIWIAYHVVLSAFHAWPEFAMHSALLVIVSYFLLGPTASAYFLRVPKKPQMKIESKPTDEKPILRNARTR